MQFMLRASDLETLDAVRRGNGFADVADAARLCIERAAGLLASGRPSRRLAALIERTDQDCREPRGRTAQRRGEKLERWSQWVRPDDLRRLESIRDSRAMRSLGQALRFSIRCHQLGH